MLIRISHPPPALVCLVCLADGASRLVNLVRGRKNLDADAARHASGYDSRQFAIARIDLSAAPLFPRLTNLCLEIPEAKYRARR